MGKVLIIDDDPQYAGLLQPEMTAAGHDVSCAPTWREGYECVASFAPDIVLLDMALPGGNGLARIPAIKAAPCLPEVLAMTEAGSEEGAEQAIRFGVSGYWQKGRPIVDLLLSVGEAIEYRAERLTRHNWRALDLGGIVGESQAMISCFESIAEASAGDVPALICGETGVGKEVIARAIHRNSRRASGPFVVVDCASLTETLVESSLFGHEKGAFTGASAERVGLVRQAHEGTLFLDEVGELPLSMQKAFLRVLQEKRFRPIGSDREVRSDFRLLAATNRDLKRTVKEGGFREDLYFRLRSFELVVPPLRARGQDVLKIADYLAAMSCERLSLCPKRVSPDLARALVSYAWPGNVRELRQVIECGVVTAGHASILGLVHLPVQIRIELTRAVVKHELSLVPSSKAHSGYPTLAEARETASVAYLAKLIKDARGDIETARTLAGISRSKLYGLLKAHRIARVAPPEAPPPAAAMAAHCRVF